VADKDETSGTVAYLAQLRPREAVHRGSHVVVRTGEASSSMAERE